MASHAKSWIAISAAIFFLWCIFLALAPFLRHLDSYLQFLASTRNAAEISVFESPKQNVWADLDQNEADGLLKFVFSCAELNLTNAAKATSRDNILLQLELLRPNKTDVLSYLKGDTGPPKRWGRVVVAQGVTEEALVVNYMVGPLPITESTTIKSLEYIFNSGRNYVHNPVPSRDDMVRWLLETWPDVSDITQALLDSLIGMIQGGLKGPDGLDLQIGSMYLEGGNLTTWVQFYRQDSLSDASWILPQGLHMKIDFKTRDPKNWKILQWYYNGINYASASELRESLKSPNFQRAPLNLNGPWTKTEDFGKGHPGREIPPPVMIQPGGPRFEIDPKENFISWMGFDFFVSTSQEWGLSLHNINFDGDSVIFEVGLQEALAHYAGDDPGKGGLAAMDTLGYMGIYQRNLVPGYDCPAYATYLSATYHNGGTSLTRSNSICVFEYTADHVLQRHTSEEHVSISKNTYLVVRSVSTMGNYDFTIDYIFYLDGTIEVKVRASGFIWAAFYSANSESTQANEYGYRVHEALATSMHDHVLNFKVDLDVAGTSNTFLRVGVEPTTKTYSWEDKSSTPRNTMHLVERKVEKKTGLNWPSNSREMYMVVNEGSKNAWGEKRGYRITPGTGMGAPSHLSIVNSTTLGRSAKWAYKDLWVVKQKDTEPRSAEPLNCIEPQDPLVDFGRFVDGEQIVDEDLIVYFNLGSHHIPHSGDIPNTLMHTSASSVMFTPFNFHDHDPSRNRVQGVKIDQGSERSKARYFGGRYSEGVRLKASDLEPDLSKYNTEQQDARNMSWIYNLMPAGN
ncbi:Membrane primary amine oxidase [Lachnellula suecica]|uniref:Amine oxidase n=1 Tax=Lachnellula suecica TaxID=602035 RepID=A0A8T9C6K0_9HELO|nr:Membrane primary amine oxidase [Lachnellula suecica]